MKKNILFCSVAILLIAGFCILAAQKVTTFLYICPDTETAGMPYIAKSIKILNKTLRNTEKSSKEYGKPFKIFYYNAYGSGFLKHNPHPNDLDYGVGVYLGEYEYDGHNASDISANIVEQIEQFYYLFNLNINSKGSRLYTDSQPVDVLKDLQQAHTIRIRSLSKYMATALKNKPYIFEAKKIVMDENNKFSDMSLQYVMKKHELLLEGSTPILLLSEDVRYNPNQMNYMREITVVPEFRVDIKYNNEIIPIDIIPEAFWGVKSQLSHRFYIAIVFVNNISKNFIKNASFYTNDDEYIFERFKAYEEHLRQIQDYKSLKPVKLCKRLIQIANIMKPIIGEEEFNDIQKFSADHLADRDLQLLNEYMNIINNFIGIIKSPDLFFLLSRKGKIKELYDAMNIVSEEMQNSKNLDAKSVKILYDFQENDIKPFLSIKHQKQLKDIQNDEFKEKYNKVKETISFEMSKDTKNNEKVIHYENIFSKIYTNSGFHLVKLYWLGSGKIGIITDDFTKNIKDIKKFVELNGLVEAEYSFINQSQIENPTGIFSVWVRYNPTEAEIKYYDNVKNILLKDKNNYNIKRKMVITK